VTFTVVDSASGADLAATCTMNDPLVQGNWLAMLACGYNATTYPSSPEVDGAAIAASVLLQDDSGPLTGSSNVGYTMWLAAITAAMAGQTALSFSPGAGGGAIKLYGVQFSASGFPAADQALPESGTGSGGSVTIGPTGAVAQAGELALFVLPVFVGYPVVTGGGFTIIGNQDYSAAGYQILGAAGSEAEVIATLPSGDQWAAGIVTLQQTGAIAAAARADAIRPGRLFPAVGRG
jgi:hypothetical protein